MPVCLQEEGKNHVHLTFSACTWEWMDDHEVRCAVYRWRRWDLPFAASELSKKNRASGYRYACGSRSFCPWDTQIDFWLTTYAILFVTLFWLIATWTCQNSILSNWVNPEDSNFNRNLKLSSLLGMLAKGHLSENSPLVVPPEIFWSKRELCEEGQLFFDIAFLDIACRT